VAWIDQYNREHLALRMMSPLDPSRPWRPATRHPRYGPATIKLIKLRTLSLTRMNSLASQYLAEGGRITRTRIWTSFSLSRLPSTWLLSHKSRLQL
jgi:hypothetical protein